MKARTLQQLQTALTAYLLESPKIEAIDALIERLTEARIVLEATASPEEEWKTNLPQGFNNAAKRQQFKLIFEQLKKQGISLARMDRNNYNPSDTIGWDLTRSGDTGRLFYSPKATKLQQWRLFGFPLHDEAGNPIPIFDFVK